MNVKEVESILKHGTPRKRTMEAKKNLRILSDFFYARTGKKIPCSWCERALLFRHCRNLLQRMNANQLQNNSNIL
jgi:hypothetical protein